MLFDDDFNVSHVFHQFLDAKFFFQQSFSFFEQLKLKFGFFRYLQSAEFYRFKDTKKLDFQLVQSCERYREIRTLEDLVTFFRVLKNSQFFPLLVLTGRDFVSLLELQEIKVFHSFKCKAKVREWPNKQPEDLNQQFRNPAKVSYQIDQPINFALIN